MIKKWETTFVVEDNKIVGGTREVFTTEGKFTEELTEQEINTINGEPDTGFEDFEPLTPEQHEAIKAHEPQKRGEVLGSLIEPAPRDLTDEELAALWQKFGKDLK